MVDTVRTQVIHDGPKNAIINFTNESDGVSGETDVIKVDMSTLFSDEQFAAVADLRVQKIEYATRGYGVNIEWDGATNALIATLPADHDGKIDFCETGSAGLKNDAVTPTGDILFSTINAPAAGYGYSVRLHLTKVYV